MDINKWIQSKVRAAAAAGSKAYTSLDENVFKGQLPGGADNFEQTLYKAAAEKSDAKFDGAMADFKGGADRSGFYVNPNGSEVTVNRVCPVNRESYKLGKAMMDSHGNLRTKDGPDYGVQSCVEAVQRVRERAGQSRIPSRVGGVKGFIRDFPVHIPNTYIGHGAQNADELNNGILETGIGRRLKPGETPMMGDIVIQHDKDRRMRTHAGVTTDRISANQRDVGTPMANSNGSGAAGTIYMFPIKENIVQGIETYRLEPQETDFTRYRDETKNMYRQSGGGF